MIGAVEAGDDGGRRLAKAVVKGLAGALEVEHAAAVKEDDFGGVDEFVAEQLGEDEAA